MFQQSLIHALKFGIQTGAEPKNTTRVTNKDEEIYYNSSYLKTG